MAFKERLKEARKRKGYTQEILANAIGVAKSTVTGYEKGNSSPDMEKLFKIMNFLEVDANYLFQDEMNELANKSKLSPEATEVAHAYNKSELEKQNIVRLTLGLELKKQSKITSLPKKEEIPEHLKTTAAHLKGEVTDEVKDFIDKF